MPTYTYKKPDGTRFDLVMSIAEKEVREKSGVIEVDGVKCKRVYAFAGLGGLDSTPGWPIKSDGAGCHPDQIPEFAKFDRERGVPTQYTPDGRPILRNRNHRRDYLKIHGLFDRQGGYGD